MKSVLTRVTKLEKKYMERKAEENDVDVPDEDDEPDTVGPTDARAPPSAIIYQCFALDIFIILNPRRSRDQNCRKHRACEGAGGRTVISLTLIYVFGFI
jgi:hypothetical protein